MQRTLILSALVVASLSGSALAQGHEGHHPAGHAMGHADHCGLPMGEGALQKLDVAKAKATIAHKPIESIGWPEMIMEFAVAKEIDLSAFVQGENVHFLLKPEKDKKYSIAMMCSIDADQGTHEACMKAMHETAMEVASGAGMKCDMKDGASQEEHGAHSDHH
jgi:Cu/Ag efflux protein CusF